MGGASTGVIPPKGQEVSAPHRKHRTKTNFSQGRILPSFPAPQSEQSGGGEWEATRKLKKMASSPQSSLQCLSPDQTTRFKLNEIKVLIQMLLNILIPPNATVI